MPLDSTKGRLGVLTTRMILALVGLVILNAILTGLSFIEEFQIPDFDLDTPTLITALIYLVAIGLLVNFSLTLRSLWPQAYPRYNQAFYLFNAIIYVVVLVMAYRVAKDIIQAFTDDSDPLTILQLVCVVVVLFIVGRASVFVYQLLPSWIEAMKASFTLPPVQMPVEKKEEKKEK